eukprot:TRINITY_DN5062_c0_g2_i4.p1 TRINITY_DN5062_c0_g2~~TRINITY_DN5062_c0_g2_i4.p1  ORF type:complete len:216 (+),score=32.93 TRINITY_DN5062_c0_g2_i4:38-685(+)
MISDLQASRAWTAALVCLLIVVCGSCSHLHIVAPAELRDKYASMKFAIAHVGFIPWNRTISGEVFYADPKDACGPLKGVQGDSRTMLSLIIAERDGCSLSTKAYWGLISGARGMILIDSDKEDIDKVNLVDPLSGGDSAVEFPIVMVSKEDGAELLANINKDQYTVGYSTLSVSLSFGLNAKTTVEVEYWMDPLHRDSYSFIDMFETYFFGKLLS